MPNRFATPVALFTLLSVLAFTPCRVVGDEPPAQQGGLFGPVWQPPSGGDGAPPPRTESPANVGFDPWPEWRPYDPAPRDVHGSTADEWGSLSAHSVLGDAASPPAWETPQQQRAWKTDGDWRCPVLGPVFLFGQFNGGGTEVARQDTKVGGQTGLGCKWTPAEDAEFTVRSGPSLSCADALRPDRAREQSEWLLQVQAHWAFLGKVSLEYQGKAAPALTPLDHDWMDQDLGLAAPICPGGKVRLGARHHWEDTPDARPTPDATQLYFGLELAH